MNVLAINGSARKNGNTHILINRILEKLNCAGIKTQYFEFADSFIKPCRACFACGGIYNCIQKDDVFHTVFENMKSADGIILGSPVYSANISASMQAFLERSAVICDMNAGLLKHKIGVGVVSARRGGALNAVDSINHFFLNHEMFVVGSTYWNMAYGKMEGDVLKDSEAMLNMDNIAENMIWLLKKTIQGER